MKFLDNNLILNTSKRIFRFLPVQFKKQMLAVSLFTFVNSWIDLLGLGAILPLFALVLSEDAYVRYPLVGNIRDFFGFSDPNHFTLLVSGFVIGVIVFKNMVGVLINRYQAGFSFRIYQWLTLRMLQVTYQKGYDYFRQHNSNHISHQVGGYPANFASGLLIPLISFFNETMTITLFAGTLLVLYPIPSLLLLGIITPLFFLFYNSTKKLVEENGRALSEIGPELSKPIFEMIFGYIDVQMTGTEAFYTKRYDQAVKKSVGLRIVATVLDNMPTRVIEVFVFLAVISVFLFGIYTMPQDEILALLGVMGLVAYRTIPTINRLMLCLQKVQGGAHILDVVEQVHGLQPAVPQTPLDIRQGIAVKNLSYHYPDAEALVLDRIDLEIKKGETIGIIGRSGSGKTTLVNILLRFLQESSGSIEVDGQKLTAQNIESWRRLIGYVRQDVFIIDGSIRENIAFGIPAEQVDQARLQRAIAQASLLPLVNSLEQGIDTPIGERGSRLSGGQRQRIGIARALYSGAKILFFDEATSALDNETEQEITESIRALADGELTMFIVAHRYTTLRYCTRIIELSRGKVSRETYYQQLINELI